jgi:hypothetical protein
MAFAESEARLLRAARALGRERPVTIRTTFLGAHAVPPEFDGDADGYIDLVCDRMLPAVAAAGLADAVDGFCEGIAFSPARSNGYSPARGNWACRSSFMPNSCRTWRRGAGSPPRRARPITSNNWTRTASRR